MTRTTALLSLVLVASPATAAIRGRVVGGGRPVANANVSAYAIESMPEMMTRVLAKRPRTTLATAASAADGTFALPVDGNGAVVVCAEAAGFAPSCTEEALGDTDVLIGVLAKHAREYTLRSLDGPVAGARVIALLEGSTLESKTDEHGKVAIDADDVGVMLVIHPHAALRMVLLRAHDGVVDVERGVPLKGKVVNARGEGVAGAQIAVDSVPAGVSAADGSFTIEGAPQHYLQLSADAGNLGGSAGPAAGAPVIRVAPRVAVSGVVRDAEKRPLRGVSLMLSNESGGDFAVSDAKGAFAFHVAPGKYGLASAGARYQIPEITLEVHAAVVKDLVATSTPMLYGIVRTSGGKPVEGVQVALAMEMAGEEASAFRLTEAPVFPRATTGPDGRFRIPALPLEQAYMLVAYKRGLPPAESGLISPGAPAREISIVFNAFPNEVSGTVKDRSGRPVAGAAVTASRSGRVVLGTFDDPPKTDPEGRFTMLLGHGRWRMTFDKEGYLTKEVMQDVSGPIKSMTAELEPASSIRGRVVRKSGSGIEHVFVIVEGTNYATTAADGSFTLPAVRAGEHVLQYMLSGGMHGEQRVMAPAADVRIALDDGGIVRGRVVDAAGAPVTSFQVAVSRSSDNNFFPQEFSDGDGHFLWNDAPAGEDTITAKASGFLPASQSVVVEAGKTTPEIVLTLRRGRTVRGKVTSVAGEPLGDVKIATSREENGLTNADGTFEIHGLDATASLLSFSRSGFVRALEKVPAGDEDARFDVQLKPGLALTGHVLAPDGQPLPNAQVTATSTTPGAGFATAKTNESGEFKLDGLMPARYVLMASVIWTGLPGERQPDQPLGVLPDVDVERVHDVTIRMKVEPHAVIYGDISGIDPAGKTFSVRANAGEGWGDMNAVSGGTYRMERAPVGTVTVQALLDDGSRWTRPVVVEVAPHSEVRADLRFVDTFTVAGRVLRRGSPMAGATVDFIDSDEHRIETVTGDDGTYRVDIAAGHYMLRIGSFWIKRDIAGPQTLDVNVDVTTVAVTVLDAATGMPISGASVSAREGKSTTYAVASAMTGSAGQAQLDLSSTVTDVVVEKDGYATAAVTAGPPSLTVKLTRSDGATVRIVDARDGRALTGYAIARDAAGRILASANEAAPDGTIHFPLPAGRYRFSASASHYGSLTVVADVPGPDVQIPLPRSGKLLLQSRSDMRADADLLQPDGEEYVRCWCNGVADIRINGRMTVVDSIAPGSYALEIKEPGTKPRTIAVSVIEGTTTTVAIDP